MTVLKIFLIINLSIVLASCSNSIIVKIDNDKRIITRELKNGKIKTINQKFNSLFHQWFDVECASKETSFTKCDDEEIIYTKLATLKIREIQKDLGSSSNEEQSSSNEEQSSSNEEQSSSNEEQSSSNEEQSSSNEEQSSSNEEQSSSNEEQSSSNEENNNFGGNDPEEPNDAPDPFPGDGNPPTD
jgi:cobalamin biosynthesis protein CobT